MIAKLPSCDPDSDDTITMGQFIDKINEIVEAVNGQHHSIQTLNSILKSVESRIKSPGFRPLHIEDGQVQETMPKWMRETRAQTFGSVPNAEPREQEGSLGACLLWEIGDGSCEGSRRIN